MQNGFFVVTASLSAAQAEKTRAPLIDEALARASKSLSFLGLHEATQTPQTRILDEGIAPADRDVNVVKDSGAPLSFYFGDRLEAQAFAESLGASNAWSEIAVVAEAPRDWNEEWRRQFMGIDIPPHWVIRPTWNESIEIRDPTKLIRLDPGLGFGSGTHPTTRMLLQRIGELPSLVGKSALDFGAGSGILAVALALKGARVAAVEIDPMALQAARETSDMNGVSDSIEFFSSIDELGTRAFDVIAANILRNVLIQYAQEILRRVKPRGILLLSGLLEEDLPDIKDAYRSCKASIFSEDEWRALKLELAP